MPTAVVVLPGSAVTVLLIKVISRIADGAVDHVRDPSGRFLVTNSAVTILSSNIIMIHVTRVPVVGRGLSVGIASDGAGREGDITIRRLTITSQLMEQSHTGCHTVSTD